MSKVILLNLDYATIYDDHTYRYKNWEDDGRYSIWKIEGDIFYWKHFEDDSWKVSSSNEKNNSHVDQWAVKIMSALVEREIFSD